MYSVSDKAGLPKNVQEMDESGQKRWVAVFNSVMTRAKKNGTDEKAAETSAFKQANGVLKASPKAAGEDDGNLDIPPVDVKAKATAGTALHDPIDGTHTHNVMGKGGDVVKAKHEHKNDASHADAAPSSASEPGTSDVHSDGTFGTRPGRRAPGLTFVKKLGELLRGKVSAEEYTDAMRTARAHAGGTAPRRQPSVSDPDGGANTELMNAYAELQGVPGYDWDAVMENGVSDCMGGCCSACDSDDGSACCSCECAECGEGEQAEEGPRLEKADQNYRVADAPSELCAVCKFYDSDDLSCRLIEGQILPQMVCDLFKPVIIALGTGALAASEPRPPVDLIDFCVGNERHQHAEGDSSRLFMRQDFAEAPEWTPILPRSGNYTHPKWGPVNITPARNEHFVANFNDHVYGQQLPIDIEHEGKAWGAVAYMHQLRQNSDGSVDALVNWNERGKTLIGQDRFKYISPEWYDEWTDPATDRTYKDVLIGAAITTRPFFKDAHLRPLVASEGGLIFGEPQAAQTGGGTMPEPQTGATGAATTTPSPANTEVTPPVTGQTATPPNAASEPAVSKEFAEMQAELKQLRESNQRLVDDGDRHRFTEMVQGHGGEDDGRRWAGEIGDNVETLMDMAKAFGEESDQFKRHLKVQRAAAEQLAASEARARKAGFYSEVGSTGDGRSAPNKGAESIEARAKQMREADPKLSKAKSIAMAASEMPEAYTDHDNARPSRNGTGHQ